MLEGWAEMRQQSKSKSKASHILVNIELWGLGGIEKLGLSFWGGCPTRHVDQTCATRIKILVRWYSPELHIRQYSMGLCYCSTAIYSLYCLRSHFRVGVAMEMAFKAHPIELAASKPSTFCGCMPPWRLCGPLLTHAACHKTHSCMNFWKRVEFVMDVCALADSIEI